MKKSTKTVMALGQWLAATKRSQSWAARQLGVTQQYISMLCRWDAPDRPSLGLAISIKALTAGQVPPEVWENKGVGIEPGTE